MTAPIERPVTAERLFLWVMHRFGEVFEHRAILKGGMALRLYHSTRSTTDIDYVFAPFSSKRDLVSDFKKTLAELEGATIEVDLHSKMLRATIELEGVRVQIEANVADECASVPMSTADFATSLGQTSHVVRVLSPGLALAHKLAAWNERRLARDMYDIYFLFVRIGASPDKDTLAARLAHIESRLPALRKTRSMTFAEFAAEIRHAANGIEHAGVEDELSMLLPAAELAGLVPRIRSAIVGVAELIETWK